MTAQSVTTLGAASTSWLPLRLCRSSLLSRAPGIPSEGAPRSTHAASIKPREMMPDAPLLPEIRWYAISHLRSLKEVSIHPRARAHGRIGGERIAVAHLCLVCERRARRIGSPGLRPVCFRLARLRKRRDVHCHALG